MIKKTTSLCFTNKGLINTQWRRYADDGQSDTLVLFCDGSQEAAEQLKQFDVTELLGDFKIAVGFTPLYELRVQRADGTVSKPHFVYSEDVRAMWIASNICTSHISITVSDVTSRSDAQAQMNDLQVQSICYFAYCMWQRLKVAETKLCFPAAAIDRLTRHTYQLTPNTLDIDKLKEDTGLATLDYHRETNMLMLEVGGDLFTVPLDVINRFYGEHILPLFNSLYGRRLRFTVIVKGAVGEGSLPTEMTYGELGALVETMTRFVKERKIVDRCPLDSADLMAFSKKVKINEETCQYLGEGQTLAQLVDETMAQLVRDPRSDYERDGGGAVDGESEVAELVTESLS